MRASFTAIALIAAVLPTVWGEPTSLDDYSAHELARVESKMRAVLSEKREADCIAGVVTLATDEAFYLQGEVEALKVICDRQSRPRAGDAVSVEGSPSLEGGRVVFVAQSWSKTGAGELPKPRLANVQNLLFVPSAPGDRARDLNWRRVELIGRAIGLTETGFALDLESMPITVLAPKLPCFMDDSGETRPKVKVTGVVELVLDQASLFGRSRGVIGVKLLVASADDIELLPDLTYLANRRDLRIRLAICAVFGLLCILIVALIVFLIRLSRRQLKTRTLMTERKRMADDLHDTIEQHLVGAGMLLQLGKTKEAREILVRARREMRDIVWGLKNDDMMRLSPSEMIRTLAHDETCKGICRVTARLTGLPDEMNASAMRDLSLIVREAISNAIKHGGAHKIAISSDPKEDGGWMLRIGNDGAPFDPAKAPGPAEGHFGVEGMRARARRLGVTVEFLTKGEWTILKLETEQ